jgi:hypothetical protein
MAHYSTLQDFQFDTDVDDLRGATLYGEGGANLGRIDDIVFDHQTGDITHLVAKEEHGRCVLVPVSMVRPAIANDRDLQCDLSREDMDRLPAFDDKMLKHDEEWKHYMQLHRQVLKDRNKAAEREYDREWTDDPVEHKTDDVAHLITPVDVEPTSNVTPIDRGRRRRNEDDYVPDLTPQRLAPVFTNTAQTPDKLNMVPHAEHSRGPAAEYQTAGLGVKWNGYQEMIRRELPTLRGACETCESDERKIA